MRSRNGFTLAELMVVTGIMSMLIAVSIAAAMIYQRQGIARTHSSISQIVLEAAQRSRYGVDNEQWGVYFDWDGATGRVSEVTLFTGATYASRDAANDLDVTVNKSILFDFDLVDLGPTSSGTEIVFTKFTGESQQEGEITLDSKGRTSAILMSENGVPVYERR